jgi:hypothetical protein
MLSCMNSDDIAERFDGTELLNLLRLCGWRVRCSHGRTGESLRAVRDGLGRNVRRSDRLPVHPSHASTPRISTGAQLGGSVRAFAPLAVTRDCSRILMPRGQVFPNRAALAAPH